MNIGDVVRNSRDDRLIAITEVNDIHVHGICVDGHEYVYPREDVQTVQSDIAREYFESAESNCTLTAGDRVTVIRASFDGERGNHLGWNNSMDNLIGRQFVLGARYQITDDGGMKWTMPFFVLEKVETPDLVIGQEYLLVNDGKGYWDDVMTHKIGSIVVITEMNTPESIKIDGQDWTYQSSAFINVPSDYVKEYDTFRVGDVVIFTEKSHITYNHIESGLYGSVFTIAQISDDKRRVSVLEHGQIFDMRSFIPATDIITIPEALHSCIFPYLPVKPVKCMSATTLGKYLSEFEINAEKELVEWVINPIPPVFPNTDVAVADITDIPCILSYSPIDVADGELNIIIPRPASLKHGEYGLMFESDDSDGTAFTYKNVKQSDYNLPQDKIKITYSAKPLAYFAYPNTLYMIIEVCTVTETDCSSVFKRIFNKIEEQFGISPDEHFQQLLLPAVDEVLRIRIEEDRNRYAAFMHKFEEHKAHYLGSLAQYDHMHRVIGTTDAYIKERTKHLLDDVLSIRNLDNVLDIGIENGNLIIHTSELSFQPPDNTLDFYGNLDDEDSDHYSQRDRIDTIERRGGPYDIEIKLSNGALKIRSINTYPGYGSWGMCPHPHVSSEGTPCLGTALEPITQLAGDQEYLFLTEFIMSYLQTVNLDDPAGRMYYNWPRNGE